MSALDQKRQHSAANAAVLSRAIRRDLIRLFRAPSQLEFCVPMLSLVVVWAKAAGAHVRLFTQLKRSKFWQRARTAVLSACVQRTLFEQECVAADVRFGSKSDMLFNHLVGSREQHQKSAHQGVGA